MNVGQLARIEREKEEWKEDFWWLSKLYWKDRNRKLEQAWNFFNSLSSPRTRVWNVSSNHSTPTSPLLCVSGQGCKPRSSYQHIVDNYTSRKAGGQILFRFPVSWFSWQLWRLTIPLAPTKMRMAAKQMLVVKITRASKLLKQKMLSSKCFRSSRT